MPDAKLEESACTYCPHQSESISQTRSHLWKPNTQPTYHFEEKKKKRDPPPKFFYNILLSCCCYCTQLSSAVFRARRCLPVTNRKPSRVCESHTKGFFFGFTNNGFKKNYIDTSDSNSGRRRRRICSFLQAENVVDL